MARTAPDPNPTTRPRTILVLGGGGMRGFGHIGVIRAMERLGIRADEVVGTSMGAVVGGLYASGLDSFRIEQVAAEIHLKDYFKLNLLKFLVKGYRHASVYKGRAFQELIAELLPQASFEDLPKPFFHLEEKGYQRPIRRCPIGPACPTSCSPPTSVWASPSTRPTCIAT